ncbi:MAG: hypothetical protein RL385_142 [Pseudomonadota bacterium]|jgi:uncharacterized protein YciI
MIYVVLLKFSSHKSNAKELLPGHSAWIERGLDEGVFLVVGSLQPQLGGVVVAHNTTRAELDARLSEDPFVVHDVVTAEVFEVSPSKADARLAFLLA